MVRCEDVDVGLARWLLWVCMCLERSISKVCFLKTGRPLLAKYLQFDAMAFHQTGEFSNPCNSEMREDVWGECRSLKSSMTSNDVNAFELAEVFQASLELHSWSWKGESEKRGVLVRCLWRRQKKSSRRWSSRLGLSGEEGWDHGHGLFSSRWRCTCVHGGCLWWQASASLCPQNRVSAIMHAIEVWDIWRLVFGSLSGSLQKGDMKNGYQ